MSDVKALEAAVKALAPAERAEFDFARRGQQIEFDLSAAALDRWMAEVVAEPPLDQVREL